jgi:hypothetical protein
MVVNTYFQGEKEMCFVPGRTVACTLTASCGEKVVLISLSMNCSHFPLP